MSAWQIILLVLSVVLSVIAAGALLWYGVYTPCVKKRVERQVATLGPALLHSGPVDLERYSGRWYEAARLPNSFQRDCAFSSATYTLNPDGESVDVLNLCSTADGAQRQVRGRAESVNGDNTALRVSFAPAWLGDGAAGDYWILHVDNDYRTAIVGSPDRRFLWFLSRDVNTPSDRIDALKQRARTKGFDVSKLIVSE